jgi:hypothetical protein
MTIRLNSGTILVSIVWWEREIRCGEGRSALMFRPPRLLADFCQRFAVLAIVCALFGFSSVAVAADSSSSDIDYPLVVFNVASMQRLRDNAGLMFESAERADMTDVVDQWTVDTLKETKGLDRNRPFGMMMYMNAESLIRPIGISYLPVTDLEEALETLAYGRGTITQVDGKSNHHEIQYSENFKIRTLYRNHYLFMVGPDGNDSSLDYNFPDPEKLTTKLSAQYDIAVSFLIKSIPIGLKTIVLAGVKSQLLADLQQRDDEPESVYRMRRASGEGWVELLDEVVNQGEELTIGGKLDPETRVGRIDVEVAGTNDSKLAKLFQNMTGKRTYFGNLLANPATFTMSTSWQLEENQRKLLVTYFEAAQRDIEKKADKDATADLGAIVEPILKTFMTTADAGLLDAFAQLNGLGQGNFVLIGGVKLSTSKRLPQQVADFVGYLKDNPNDNEALENMELAAESIDSFPVHRIPVTVPGDGQRLFGESADFYVYASPQALWFAFGGETTMDTLRESVATVALPQAPQQGRNRVPFQFVTHAKNWLTVADTENPARAGFNERAEASFASDNDAMTVEVRPTDRGLRLRFEFESGFLSLMGRGITNGIETGAFQRRNGRRQDGEQSTPDSIPRTRNE